MKFASIFALSLCLASPNLQAEIDLYSINILGKSVPKVVADLVVEEWAEGERPDTAGKYVLLDFSATWCGPCRIFLPTLNKIQAEFTDDLVVIEVAYEELSHVESVTHEALGEKALFYTATDTQRRMFDALGISAFPVVFLIDPNGIVKYQGFPFDSKNRLTISRLEELIQ